MANHDTADTRTTTNMSAGGAAKWTTRETVFLAVIGVVFAMLYLGWVQLWLAVQALTGPLAMDVLFGFWFSGSIFAAYLIRKPFASFLAAILASFIQILAGNPSGAVLLLTGLVQGAGSEVPLALFRWKRYSLPVLMASGACASLFSFVYNWFRFSYWELNVGLVIAMLIIRLLSGIFLGGVLGKVLGDAVARTGVTGGLAIESVTGR